jgi:MFS family permease
MVGFLTFLPVLFAGRGHSLEVGGRLVTLFLLASAIGAISGGYLADVFSAKRVMGISLASATPVLLGAIWMGGHGSSSRWSPGASSLPRPMT